MVLALDEAGLIASRIIEWAEQPLPARFDRATLTALHAHIFQDFPAYQPGTYRAPAPQHLKARALETGPAYYVPYAPRAGLEARLDCVLARVDVPAWSQFTPDVFAATLADLYGDLDYCHPFTEGNSRTLRTFTRAIAQACGFALEWGPTNVTPAARDALYGARDRAVLQRAYPGLDQAQALVTDDRIAYESWFLLYLVHRGPDLPAIIRTHLTPLAVAPPPPPRPGSPGAARPRRPLTPGV